MKTTLRPVRAEDANAIAAIYRPIVESTCISFEEIAPDDAEIAKRIAEVSRSYPWLVAEAEGTVSG